MQLSERITVSLGKWKKQNKMKPQNKTTTNTKQKPTKQNFLIWKREREGENPHFHLLEEEKRGLKA